MKLENDPVFKEIISGKYKCRNSKKEKEAFISYLQDKYGNRMVTLPPFKYKLIKRYPFFNIHGTNILIGDLEKATIIITAHYDTPLVALFHAICSIKRKVNDKPGCTILCRFFCLFIVLSFIIFLCIYNLHLDLLTFLSSYFGPLFILYVFMILLAYIFDLFFKNPNNANDNSASVCLALNLLERYPEKIAAILFDQEEKGRLGSKYMQEELESAPEYQNKLFINLDSIGCKDIIFIRDDDNCHLNSDSPVIAQLNVLFKESLPTDYTNLPKGRRIDITTANGDIKDPKSQNYGYIHSKGDTEIDPDMIDNVISIIEDLVL